MTDRQIENEGRGWCWNKKGCIETPDKRSSVMNQIALDAVNRAEMPLNRIGDLHPWCLAAHTQRQTRLGGMSMMLGGRG